MAHFSTNDEFICICRFGITRPRVEESTRRENQIELSVIQRQFDDQSQLIRFLGDCTRPLEVVTNRL